MNDPKKLQQTLDDIQEVKEKILSRHSDNPTFSLRVGSVFDKLVDSISGNVTGTTTGFKPQPLEMVAGKSISGKAERPAKQESFEEYRENVQKAYDSFLDRENSDLKDSLMEQEIRGVAKLAGLDDFSDAKVDGHYLNKIKKAITTQKQLEADKAKQLEADKAAE